MLLHGLNTVQGKLIPFAALSLNLQYEILFINGSPSGVITHYDNTVYLEESHNGFFDQIQEMLWDRTKTRYLCVNWSKDQERELNLRIGWAFQRLCEQVKITLGHHSDDELAITVVRRGDRYTFEHASRLYPVIIKDYDEPGNTGMCGDDCVDDPDYNCDDGGIFYRVTRS